MKKMLTLLIVLMTCLSLSGCGTWNCPEPEHIIKTLHYPTSCGHEVTPTYAELDPDKHIGSAENVNVLISNINGKNGHIDGLNKIIDCYDKQIEQAKQTEKTNVEN